MENNNEHNIKKGHFDAFVHAVGSEIEQAQVRLITAANAQMLFHYWKMGNYILYHQHLHGLSLIHILFLSHLLTIIFTRTLKINKMGTHNKQ